MTDLKKLRELAVAICKTDFESEDFNDTLLIDHVVAKGGTMRIAFEMTKPLRDFIAAANPQAIIEILDMVDRYREALSTIETLSSYSNRIVHIDTARKELHKIKWLAREALDGDT